MSEHKTGTSTFDKKLYSERRAKGLRGQIGYANVHQSFEGSEERIPIRFKKPRKSKGNR